MSVIGVSNCPSCHAVVNVKWIACPACHRAINGIHHAPPEVGDRISYQVPSDPEKGPFEVVDVSQDNRKGGWWAVVLKPSENEEGEPKPDTLALASIHQIIVTRVIPKESQTP